MTVHSLLHQACRGYDVAFIFSLPANIHHLVLIKDHNHKHVAVKHALLFFKHFISTQVDGTV